MLARVLEPEVMDTADEAREYDAMEHSGANGRFVTDLLAERPIGPSVLDVGTGTARIPIELCTREPDLHVVAVDLAKHMLALGAKNVAAAGLDARITLQEIDAKRLPYDDGAFATTMSNSIVHHIADPRTVLAEMNRVTTPGGLIFVRDLARPSTDAEVDRLVALHAGTPPEEEEGRRAFENQRELLRASLKAALTVEEVAAMAADAGLAGCSVRFTGDRHWTLTYRKA